MRTSSRRRFEFTQNDRVEWILVGSNAQDVRFVLLERAISLPSP
jgi:hypothetical protein